MLSTLINFSFVSRKEGVSLLVADAAICSPLMIEAAKMKTMNYLDEEFAYLELDDNNLRPQVYNIYR